jgi:flagellum-specific ATP synthase
MVNLITPAQFDLVRRFKQLYSRYQRSRDLIAVGAYVAGSDPMVDQAIQLMPLLEKFLQQDLSDRSSIEATLAMLQQIFPSIG